MQRSLAAGILFTTLLLTGCGRKEVESIAGTTPEATFDAMKTAAAKPDWVGVASCMTTDSQEELIGHIFMIVSASEDESDPADKAEIAKMKTPKDILAKHGLDASKGIELKPGVNPAAAMKKLIAAARGKTECAGELIAWAESDSELKKAVNSPSDIVNSTLSAVKVDGDTAVGKRTVKQNGKDVVTDAKFKKVNENWLLDMSREPRR